jgi:uncharacterized protein YjbI with pentapeptide repeats
MINLSGRNITRLEDINSIICQKLPNIKIAECKILDLSNNLIEKIDMSLIPANIKYINLTYNKINEIIFDGVDREELLLSNNNLKILIIENNNIKRFDIASNDLEYVKITNGYFDFIDLTKNKIQDIDFKNTSIINLNLGILGILGN